MSQRAFFSTAGSEIMGQSQILDGLPTTNLGPAVTSVQFQSSGCSTSVLYQSTVTPTFYTSTGSPFHSTGAFLPPTVDDRKEYVAVLPAGVQINEASGLIPANGRGTLASVGTVDSSNSVAQLTAVPLSHVQLAPVQLSNDGQSNSQQQQQQQIIYEHYYVDQQHPSTSSSMNANSRTLLPEASSSGADNANKDFTKPSGGGGSDTCSLSGSDSSALQLKRQKQADAARQRYQRMTLEERKEVNQKRTEAQKRKRQKDKELEELESLLRQSKDIEDDPAINEQLREKRIRARRAEAARQRYQRMSSEERRAYNQRRRFRQLGIQGAKKNGMDEEKLRQHIIQQNAKKAEAARLRYHRMTDEEKRLYNQRRTEAFRRRRIEEEILLSTPAGRISAEALNKAQQIMMRNAKRAEAARLRYQRMTPEQRRAYNQKRSRAKKERERLMRAASEDALSAMSSMNGSGGSVQMAGSNSTMEPKPVTDSIVSEEVLSTLERDVLKRTRQANMVLMRQKRISPQEQFVIVSTNPDGTQTVIPATTTEDGKQIFHIPATATTTEDGKQVFHIPAITQQLISTDPNTLTLVDDSSKLLGATQQPLQIASVPQLITVPQQHHINNSNSHEHGETSHQVALNQQQVMPQLAELHNVQETGSVEEAAVREAEAHGGQVDAHGQLQVHQQQPSSQQQPQHIIVTLQEPQQTMQHQIIVTDLNQATGAVLTSMSGHGRSRGRPPIYAAAAAAIQQQGGVVLPPGQVTIATSPMVSTAESKPSYRITPRQVSSTPTKRDILAAATAASVGPSDLTPEQKLEIQRAKRAERARMRYHNMSAEERRNFNARRAKALRTARMRDDELCRMAERAQMSGSNLDASVMVQVAEAQRRRAKRAEAARLKYHRMSSEERRQYNAMRDAQRRQRKRQKEEQELLERQRQQEQQQQQQQQQQPQSQQQQQTEMHEATHEQVTNHESNNEQILYDSYIRYDNQMDHSWAVES